MRIDPTSVFIHTIASLPLRLLLAWVVGTLGAFTPLLIRHGVEAFGVAHFQAIFFPFYLLVVAISSGWWSFISIPLLLVFAWHFVTFIREEGYAFNLLWIYLLPFLITIHVSSDSWQWAALLAGVCLAFTILRQRALPPSPI